MPCTLLTAIQASGWPWKITLSLSLLSEGIEDNCSILTTCCQTTMETSFGSLFSSPQSSPIKLETTMKVKAIDTSTLLTTVMTTTSTQLLTKVWPTLIMNESSNVPIPDSHFAKTQLLTGTRLIKRSSAGTVTRIHSGITLKRDACQLVQMRDHMESLEEEEDQFQGYFLTT